MPTYALVYPDQWTPKLLLIGGFGAGGIYCLLEARRARVILSPAGLSSQGAFSRARFVPWDQIASLIEYDTLQMLCLRTKSGQRVWISYMLGGLGTLIARFNQHGLVIHAQQPAVDGMRAALGTSAGGSRLVWLWLPFVAIFKCGGRYAVVFANFANGGFNGYYVHYTASSPQHAMCELLELIHNFTVCADRELAEALSEDIGKLIADPLAWPPEQSD